MTTLQARRVRIATAEKYGFDIGEFAEYMAEFGYTTRIQARGTGYGNVIAIMDPETNEPVDFAHPIVITYKGEQYGDVYLAEMESNWDLGGEWFSTIDDDIEIKNY